MRKVFWTAARDKKLLKMKEQGKSAQEIAEALGVTRNAVLGRHVRLRGMVFPSQVKRAKEQRVVAAKREKERYRNAMAAIKKLDKELAKGLPRGQVYLEALNAGARLREIGEHFGVTRQAIQFQVSIWRERLAIRAEMAAERAAAERAGRSQQ